MDLFGSHRLFQAPQSERPPKRGPARFFQVLWDNLGGLLGGNLLTFAGFLPLALGVSLGVVYENLWIALPAGGLGGAVAGLFWLPMLSLALQAFQGGTSGWFARWRQSLSRAAAPAAILGGLVGILVSGFLLAGALMLQPTGLPDLIVPLVSLALFLDFFLLALLSTLCFPLFCTGVRARHDLFPTARSLLFAAPGRAAGAALGLLVWCALAVALFPTSIPFALILGFWPPALLTAQLLLPPMARVLDLSSCGWEEPDRPAPPPDRKLTGKERTEIWWRRRWPVAVILTGLIVLIAWGGSQLFSFREPDLQIAVVHRTALPDDVRSALERALAAEVGDLNGDGQVRVQVNDYTVVFDGTASDPDMQTAGSALLASDLAVGDSALYVAEDPSGFLSRYADRVDGQSAALWSDFPVLSALDAGRYYTVEDIDTELDGQDLLASFTVLPCRSAPAQVLDLLLKK